MTDLTDARKMMLNGSYAKLRSKTAHAIHELQSEATFFKDVDWDMVRHPDNSLELNVFHQDVSDVPKVRPQPTPPPIRARAPARPPTLGRTLTPAPAPALSPHPPTRSLTAARVPSRVLSARSPPACV